VGRVAHQRHPARVHGGQRLAQVEEVVADDPRGVRGAQHGRDRLVPAAEPAQQLRPLVTVGGPGR